ncbi:MAG: MlaD family protein [Myxococcota bacterium]
MDHERRNYIVVGVFVLGMLAALLLWIALLSGRTGATDDYHVVYANVGGLKKGVQVFYEGYPVGLIEGISPVQEAGRQLFRVDVSVRRDWRIPEDSSAAIQASGILAAVVIDIRGGKSQLALEPGSRIQSVEATNLMATFSSVADQVPQVVETIASVADEMNATLARVNDVLSPGNTQRIERILSNLDSASSSIASLTRDLRGTRARLDEILVAVNGLVRENRDDLSASLSGMREILESMANHIDSINYNLEATTRNMNEFTRQIRDNPGLLLRGRSTESTAASAK